MFGFLRNRRRARLRRTPLDEAQRAVLEARVPLYRKLPPQARAQLEGHTQVLLREKYFEGCAGFDCTAEARLIIAAQAALPLLGDPRDYYPGLYSVLVYPRAFWVDLEEPDEAGIVHPDEAREGEAWSTGAIVLSWDDIESDLKRLNSRNVVLHEFAHWLFEFGGPQDVPQLLEDPHLRDEWHAVMLTHYEQHVRAVQWGDDALFDEYGAESEAEFFAVLTEAFFEQPVKMRRNARALYAQLCRYYRQDPALYFTRPGQEADVPGAP